ncbi:MAG: hypothetical protein EOO61_13040 [Hymenobacter sp.]|nr:MAG: hypothetical protein EOO61_13040 [Hymenobacter sp.]
MPLNLLSSPAQQPCAPLIPLRAGDTVTLASKASSWQAVIVEVHLVDQAELTNGLCLPLAELYRVETDERWCAIKGYEDRYRLSNHGKVVSLHYLNTSRQRLLKVLGPQRYPSVSLGNGISKRQTGLNRLVAQHFLPPPTEKRFCILMPKDGNHLNIKAENLRWVDKQEMNDTSVVQYLHCCGARHPAHKLSTTDCTGIR